MTGEINPAPHPVWIRPKTDELEHIVGECGDMPIKSIDVFVDHVSQLDNPTIRAYMQCMKFPQGQTIETSFPLMDAASTNAEQTTLGVETTALSVSSLCKVCEFRVQDLSS